MSSIYVVVLSPLHACLNLILSLPVPTHISINSTSLINPFNLNQIHYQYIYCRYTFQPTINPNTQAMFEEQEEMGVDRVPLHERVADLQR